jgi:ankyrin repeat protein
MDILFQKGADPNKLDFIKKTPLDSAALVDNVEVVKYLLEHSADPGIRDDQHMTAYE